MTVIDVFFFFILSFILSFSVCSCVRIDVFLFLCFLVSLCFFIFFIMCMFVCFCICVVFVFVCIYLREKMWLMYVYVRLYFCLRVFSCKSVCLHACDTYIPFTKRQISDVRAFQRGKYHANSLREITVRVGLRAVGWSPRTGHFEVPVVY